jgi:hypothetical protein
MSDKLLNNALITTQVEFDQFGSFKMTEVLDASVLEAVGGGEDIKIPIPGINFFCPTTTNNCPPPTPPKPPSPAPEKPPEKPPELDGDE